LRCHLRESIATKQRVLAECEGAILDVAGLIAAGLGRGGKLLLCGNGGSAADCQHIAAEFVSVLTQDYLRPGLPAIALTTDTSVLTANANDFGFDGVFERQVQALARPGDVLIGISTSGNSRNVLRALEYARGHEVAAVAMTGGSGGSIAGIAQWEIRVPSSVTMHIQEAHITIGHILCDLVQRVLGTPQ
jgi:D-sedoheptulose 7-phosphate isomerase